MSEYEFIDHTYDVVVVGAGGSGLRATFGLAEAGFKTEIWALGRTRGSALVLEWELNAQKWRVGDHRWRPLSAVEFARRRP